jgi:Flp pilus assembly protein TadD
MKSHADYHVLAVFLTSMLFYLPTACPTVAAGDSGDLITASYTLGVAHPTGYPLYMIAGRLFSLIPVGSIAYRYNLMSALFCALTAVLTSMSVRLLTNSPLAGAGSGLLLAFSQVMWDQATAAEVYGIHGFFTALILWLTLRWRNTRKGRDLAYVAVAYGLSLTNHITMLIYIPAFAYILEEGNVKVLKKIDLKKTAVSLLAPLLLYLYIPLRAAGDPAYNWGNPGSLGRFLGHTTGYIHRRTYVLTLTGRQVFERFFGILYHIFRQFSLPGALVLLGLYGHGGKEKAFIRFTGLMAAADIVYALFLNDVSLDITPFSIPTIVVLAAWSGFGFMDAFKWLRWFSKEKRLHEVFVLVSCLFLVIAHYNISDRSRNLLAYDYGMNMLKTADADAVIFAEGDNAVLPLSYLLLVEKVRPDVTLYERSGLISHNLYGLDFTRLEEAEHNARQREVEMAFVEGGRPIYYTLKPDIEFPGCGFVQTGLLFNVVCAGERLADKDYWSLYDMRQVWNTTIHLDEMSQDIKATYYLRLASHYYSRDRYRSFELLKAASIVTPDNVDIWFDLGNILLGQREYREAVKVFKKALQLDPEDERVHNNLGYAYALLGDEEAAGRQYLNALELNPYYHKARYNLAGLLVNQGNTREAVEQYRLIIEFKPDYSSVYLQLGRIYYNTGDPLGAADMWEKYLQLEPDDPVAPELAAKIAEIRGG